MGLFSVTSSITIATPTLSAYTECAELTDLPVTARAVWVKATTTSGTPTIGLRPTGSSVAIGALVGTAHACWFFVNCGTGRTVEYYTTSANVTLLVLGYSDDELDVNYVDYDSLIGTGWTEDLAITELTTDDGLAVFRVENFSTSTDHNWDTRKPGAATESLYDLPQDYRTSICFAPLSATTMTDINRENANVKFYLQGGLKGAVAVTKTQLTGIATGSYQTVDLDTAAPDLVPDGANVVFVDFINTSASADHLAGLRPTDYVAGSFSGNVQRGCRYHSWASLDTDKEFMVYLAHADVEIWVTAYMVNQPEEETIDSLVFGMTLGDMDEDELASGHGLNKLYIEMSEK